MTLKISSDNIQSSGVSAGSYTNANITVNEAGQITSASNGVAGSGGSGGSGGTGTFFTYTYTGDGTTTTFAGGSGMTVHNVIIAENGVVQYPTTDYTVSGSNIVFTTAPASGVLVQIRILAGGSGTPKITSIAVTDSSYNNLDDTAVNISGGYIKIAGTDFAAGCQVVVGSQVATSVTFISSTEVRAQVPAQTAGTYTVYLTNSDGGVAIRVNALNYSATPTWTSTSPLPGSIKNTAISLQLAATSNSSVTYTLQAGSTLPSGLTLSSGGLLSGTTPNISSETTYNFTIVATDAEAQDTPQAFQITISVGDPYYPLVTLHLPGNGTNLANNNTFLDGSTNNFTITRNGNTTQGTFSPFSQTGWGNYFDGTGDYLACGSNAAYQFGTGDFTIEFWQFTSGYNGVGAKIFQYATDGNYSGGGYGADMNSLTNLTFYTAGAASTLSATLTAYQWNHVAIVRSSSTTKIYINGNSAASSSDSTNYSYTGTYPFAVGSGRNGSGNFNSGYTGYLSSFRVVKGTAVYTGNFTPPTAPLTAITNTQLLTCQSNRFLDTSTNNFTITPNGDSRVVAFSPFNSSASWSAATNGGSGYFDGTGDYLSVANTGLFGSGDWTVEMWINAPVGQTDKPILECRNPAAGAGTTTGFTLTLITSTEIRVWSGSELLRGTVNYINTWAHVAVSKKSGTTRLYLNGTSVASTASLGTMSDTTFLVAAGYYGNTAITAYGQFYMSGLRVLTGTGYDTSTITIPTSPSTAITNTSLLLNFTNAGIYDATSKNDLETVGDAQISTTQSKWGGSSMYFDGSGDYLNSPSMPMYSLGTGDFTIEFWAYWAGSSFSNYSTALDTRNASLANGVGISTNITNGYWYVSIGAQEILSSTPPSATWQHIAVTRQGTSLKLFINGTQGGSTYTSSNNFSNTTVRVGARGDLVHGSWNGYLQDLRITNGYARYTSNFTPPTAAFPAQ